ncbi:methylated-DNA--[protein]-cysteine S-methyltransferase [Acinetobacter courvalinii]|uniref:methylated-DNA--[protein]-cysteine S-methyltransferase n=1 Tax=Acinetobacter TaxID=469 RepID=UPI0004473169|nr:MULTISPECIES: methylated-DNA--[protein]-cysteine S-methyltransferase [Acinetobacter]EXB25637.1 methylated-DNA-[]-cysteine S-methyltransferase family protein [Acinetobacter baumannii 1437282]MCU4391633.1 methylated-DNA--[protein]-cysteine S-methyltransferase [Acinetobacter courvalinii]MDR2061212.1 methylated-DNA--[protein]-cysteine S-methyltransferase [Acinetobacter sp.]OEC89189.1 glycosyltransferase [Acinetobacter sp. YK3]
MQLVYMYMDSPVGALKLVAHDQALVAVMWDNEDHKRVRLAELVEDRQHPMLHKVKQQLEEYFAGQRQQFDLPLDFQGTAFQQQVWQALLNIPYGETRSYKEIAVQLGNEKAVRAVGAANGKNPISIIAPCHRVIGSSGALVGFAGGLDKKQILLSLEQSQIP